MSPELNRLHLNMYTESYLTSDLSHGLMAQRDRLQQNKQKLTNKTAAIILKGEINVVLQRHLLFSFSEKPDEQLSNTSQPRKQSV